MRHGASVNELCGEMGGANNELCGGMGVENELSFPRGTAPSTAILTT